MKKFIKSMVSMILVVMLLSSSVLFVACNNDKPIDDPSNPSDDNKTYYNNGKDPLVFSTQEVDKNFNPFFYTTGPDGQVVGMTQISMLANDALGKPVWGDEYPVVVKDMQETTQGEGEDQTTTYTFVLKNNVRFSNGSYLTIKDVLFNLYVYLDPAYTGSSTIYSTDIVGLQAYRTQQASEKEQEAFMKQFEFEAETRIETLAITCQEINNDHKEGLTIEEFTTILKDEYEILGASYANLSKDFLKATELFLEELESDYSNNMDTYMDQLFTDSEGTVHRNLFTTDVEQFLYAEGLITWNKKEGKLESALANDVTTLKSMSKEEAIDKVYKRYMPSKVHEIVTYWATATELNTYIVNSLQGDFFSNPDNIRFKNISGIKFANKEQEVVVNGKTYGIPEYEGDDRNQVKQGSYEVLSITIHKVDPKAIWNFALGIAPMYYYSDAAHIAAFDYESNFGVERANPDFFDEVLGATSKTGVPVGAGPYVASKGAGGTQNVTAGTFCEKGVIYFESNPYYVAGEPKIKKVRFQVVASAQMLNSLYNGEIDFAEPNAKPETIQQLNDKASDGIGNKSVTTLGYGYIGINASKVPSIKVRQAIMHAINTQLCVDYYKTTASAIHRPMSTESWAYPEGATPYYPYIGNTGTVPENLRNVNPDYRDYIQSIGAKAGDTLTFEQQKGFIEYLVKDLAGYTLDANDVYVKGQDKLEYTFTIAGQEEDHPAFLAMTNAAALLNKCGFNIKVTTDANALNKLATGALQVWAAAWGSSIDPDMYQVYHMDSKATSVNNWGYPAIKANNGGKYDIEYSIITELSDLIDQARETTNQATRARIYSDALDLVMELAVELPTYQRDDLFAYNTNKIDVNTLNLNPTSVKGLTSDMHLISLVVEQ